MRHCLETPHHCIFGLETESCGLNFGLADFFSVRSIFVSYLSLLLQVKVIELIGLRTTQNLLVKLSKKFHLYLCSML